MSLRKLLFKDKKTTEFPIKKSSPKIIDYKQFTNQEGQVVAYTGSIERQYSEESSGSVSVGFGKGLLQQVVNSDCDKLAATISLNIGQINQRLIDAADKTSPNQNMYQKMHNLFSNQVVVNQKSPSRAQVQIKSNGGLERRVYQIDIGNVPLDQVDAYLQAVINNLQKFPKRNPDPSFPEINPITGEHLKNHPQTASCVSSVKDDIFIPFRDERLKRRVIG